MDEKPIKPYNYKPEPLFYGSGNLFYGVELEIDKGGEYSSSAEILMDVVNRDSEHMYCKHDGSINCGFEMVLHPMTLDYHLNSMNWLDVFNKAVAMLTNCLAEEATIRGTDAAGIAYNDKDRLIIHKEPKSA